MVDRNGAYPRAVRGVGGVVLFGCGLLGILATTVTAPALPHISGLRLAATSAAFMAGGGEVTVGIELAYTDSDADLATLWFKAGDRAPSSVPLGASAESTSGRITNSVQVATTASGAVAVEVWVVDGVGHSSNHLVETFTVLGGVELSGLALSTGALDPDFDPAVRSYVSTASFLEDSVAVTATLSDPRSTLRVNGAAAVSREATAPIPLGPGETLLTVSVAAEPGGGSASYTVRVTRLVANNVWVAADDRILLLSATGGELAIATGVFGQDRFRYGTGADVIAVDETDGALWVTDTSNDRVLKLGPDGTPLFARSVVSPMAAWVDPRDRAVWISAAAGTTGRDLVKLSSAGDELVRVVGFSSSVVSIDGDPLRGTIWVADDGADVVVRLAGSDAELAGYDAAPATGPHHLRIAGFPEPRSVAVNPYDDTLGTGNVWVANRVPGEAVKLSPDGAVLLRVPSAGYELRHAAVNVLDGSVWTSREAYLSVLNLRIYEAQNYSAGGAVLPGFSYSPGGGGIFSLDSVHELIWFAQGTQAVAYSLDGTRVVVVGMPGICRPECVANIVRDIAVQPR
jgi:hypothetical protein